MTIDEAIRVLGIDGYPTTIGCDDLETALGHPSADDGDTKTKRTALVVVREFLRQLRRDSAELRAAFEQIPWGAGSTTEYQGLRSALSDYGGLEVREAERRGAPKGAVPPDDVGKR